MSNKKRLFYILIVFFITFCVSFFLMMQWNRFQVNPTSLELNLLKKNFGNIDIKSEQELLNIQHKVVQVIKHEFLSDQKIVLDSVFKYKKGFCYDRSLILQKICIYNHLEIRPVFLYYNLDYSKPNFFNLLDQNLQTHNVFEVNLNGKWFMIQTNKMQDRMKTLEEYLSSGISVPQNSLYIRHLNNRNGHFIAPSFIPDIY